MRITARIRGLWLTQAQRHRAERSLDDELHAYVDLLAAEYEHGGISPNAARRRALVETGGIEQVKEATRDAWIGAGVAAAVRELQFTLRALRNAPVFLLVATTILAVGIGGATAIFTVIKGSLFRPLPAVSQPETLVSLEPIKRAMFVYDFSYPDYRDLAEQMHSLSGLTGFDGTPMILQDQHGARQSSWVSYVTGNFFAVLGVQPAAGRLIQPSDEQSANPVVVLAYDLWRERYDGNPSVIGSTIDLAGHPLTVIGVAPPGFIGAMLMHPMELWIPITTLPTLVSTPGLDNRGDAYIRLIGRLAPNGTVGDARREASLVAARLAATYPVDLGRDIRVSPGAGMTVEERVALAKLPRLLAVAVGLLLLITCANVANLSLVRSATRRRELATRLALGASRLSLIARQLLEAGVLSTAGALLGIGMAQMLVRSQGLIGDIAGMPPRVGLDVRLDWRVLIVALAAAAFTAFVVSITPVVHVMHVAPGAVLKDGAAGAVRRRSLGQRALVSLQIAASLAILASAAVVFSTFRRALATNPGFDARGLTVVGADLWQVQFDSAQMIAYRREWLRRAAAEPSLAGAATASVVPPSEWARAGWVFRAGEAPPPGIRLGDVPARGTRAYLDVVSPGFFDVMQLPIVMGRGFRESDDDRDEPVVIVSSRLATATWPNESPLGKVLSYSVPGDTRRSVMRVVGVAGDVRFTSIFDDEARVAYAPVAQHPGQNLRFVVRSRNPEVPADAIARRIGTAADPRVPVYTNAVTGSIDEQLDPQRVASAWIGVFGMIALLLAAIGLYGVIAQGVLQRTRELALRAALGAEPRGILSMVIGEGMRIATIGAGLGTAIGATALRVLQSQFPGISVGDARGAAVALAVVCVTLVAACYVPARRASRLNPSDALRCD
ncbi:MAG TPA: ADOP family duplicated permease [Gemmatimonadaceae bacterium]|nr:ADOP family duplicated permease [Gemmatimonadaceae bacterium]